MRDELQRFRSRDELWSAALPAGGRGSARPWPSCRPRRVLFNYLGQFDQVVAGSEMFGFARSNPRVLAWSARNERTHRFEVVRAGTRWPLERLAACAPGATVPIGEHLAEDFVRTCGTSRKPQSRALRATPGRLPTRTPRADRLTGLPHAPGSRGRVPALTDAAALPLDGVGKDRARFRAVGVPPQGALNRRRSGRLGRTCSRATHAANRLREQWILRTAAGRKATGLAPWAQEDWTVVICQSSRRPLTRGFASTANGAST